MLERDAKADLAVCAAMSPPPWFVDDSNSDQWAPFVYITGPDYLGTVCEFPKKRAKDAQGVAMAREALPWWINRALALTADLAELKALLARCDRAMDEAACCLPSVSAEFQALLKLRREIEGLTNG